MEFYGYRRPDGRAGTRNHVLILPSCACGSETARLVAAQVRGAVNIIFNTGCSDVAANTELSQRVLQGFALDDKQSLGAEQNNLQSALVFSPDAAAQSAFKVWSGRMESILELLSQEKDAVNYKLQPVDAADHQRLQVAQGLTDQELAIARYRYFSIAVGDGKPSERYSTFVRGKDLPVISQAALNNDEITLNFFKYSDSTAPECQYVLDGAFPSLQLYLNRRGEFNAESKVTYVPLHLVDNSGQESLFYLAVSFSSELPSREDWPSKNNWPDLAKLSKF